MATFSNSVQIVKDSFGVLKDHKKLVVFPLVSGILSLVLIGAIMVPGYLVSRTADGTPGALFYVFLAVFYALASFVIIFFNTGLIYCASVALQGGEPSVGEGFACAGRHLPRIIGWALISATVGMVFRLIRDRGGIIGNILAGLIAVAWNVITFFVIPVMIFEEKGVIDSIKDSAGIFKRTWGENLVARFSVGLVFFLLGLIGVVPAAAVLLTGNTAAIVSVWLVVFAYFMVLAVLSGALNGVLAMVLYGYATNGQVPQEFSAEAISSAFGPKPAKGRQKRK